MAQNKKRILVTGSTGGVGRSLSLHLASIGYDLILTARTKEKLQNLKTEIDQKYKVVVEIVPSDFGSPDSLNALVKTSEVGIDGIVLMPPQLDPTADCLPSNDTWEKIFKYSFINPVGLIRDLIPSLKIKPRAKVVIVSGISSAQVLGHYATSNVLRLAWLAQAKTLAHAYGPENIHFNTLSLGGVLTDEYMVELEQDAKDRGIGVEDLLKEQVSNVPLRKYATPKEVAVALEGLLSPFCDHMSGLNILCDGGFTRAY
jgi:3-oxoacyl-[acyl-carrier protein] reductase